MRFTHTLCLLPILLAAVLVVPVSAADEVTHWNQVMYQVATLPSPPNPAPTNPLTISRNAAIVQAAVFEAINGIERQYTSILRTKTKANVPRTASQNAAVMQAAYVSLMNLYSSPAAVALLNAERASSLAAIQAAETVGSGQLIAQGISFGQEVADAVWASRAGDGFNTNAPTFDGTPITVGHWRPTPPAFALGAGYPQFSNQTPWVMSAPWQFRPVAPPALGSPQYVTDFDETRVMTNHVRFGDDPADPTNDHKKLSLFWNAGTASAYWNRVGVSFAENAHFSQLETARMLALIDLAMADAAIGCWDAKYEYTLWRPITAIPIDYPGWTTLFATPAHPEYPSGHSCQSGAAAQVLKTFFGDTTGFTLAANAPETGSRTYANFTAALEEVKNARVFAGIHFRTATVVGTTLGKIVADYVLENAMVPLKAPGVGQLTK
jgi:hypothetical protein